MRNLKAGIIGLTLFLMLFIFTGCDLRIMYVGTDFGDQIKASYKFFTGTEAKNIELNQGDIVTVNYSSEVKEGNLSIQLFDPEYNLIKKLETNQSGDMEFQAEHDGNYRVEIKGEKAKGNFKVIWSTK